MNADASSDRPAGTTSTPQLTRSLPESRASNEVSMSQFRLVFQKMRSPSSSPGPSPDVSPASSPRADCERTEARPSGSEDAADSANAQAAKSKSLPVDYRRNALAPGSARDLSLGDVMERVAARAIHKPLDSLDNGFAVWKPYVRSQTLYMVMKTIYDYGLNVEGIFTKPGSPSMVEDIERAFRRKRLPEIVVKLREDAEGMRALADAMQHLLQRNGTPLVPFSVFEEMMNVIEDTLDSQQQEEELLGLLFTVPQANLYELAAILHLAHEVLNATSHCDLKAKALAISLGRNVMFDPSPSLDVLTVRREVRYMTDIIALFTRCFPEIYQDLCSGEYLFKAQAARARVQAHSDGEGCGDDECETVGRKHRSPRKKAAALVSNILKRSEDHKEAKRRHNMLKMLNMALACYAPETLCALTFYEVQDILFTAGFSSEHISDNEAFLRKATLLLITEQHCCDS